MLYQAGALGAFKGPLIGAVLCLVLGAVGLFQAVRGRNPSSTGGRVGMGAVSGFLALVAVTLLGLVGVRWSQGPSTFTARLTDADEVRTTCGQDGDQRCTNYVLTFQDGDRTFDVDVDERAVDGAEVGSCYEVEHYDALFAFLQEDTGGYEHITSATKVVPAECPAA